MLKFLRWFMKLLRPESSRFVRNIQTDSVQGKATGQGLKAGKRTIREKDLIFWIPTGKIVEIDKNSQGQTRDIHLASGAGFVQINFSGNLKQSAKKQGLSKVVHHLEFILSEGDSLMAKAPEFISKSTTLSILHVDRYGDGFFYGEEKGLSITAFDNKLMVLEGTEDNVFYELTNEYLKKVIPKSE